MALMTLSAKKKQVLGYLSLCLCFLESLTFAQLREETVVKYERGSVQSS